MRIGRWTLDETVGAVVLTELGGPSHTFATGDLNTLMRLFTAAWKATRPVRHCRYCQATDHFGDRCPSPRRASTQK